MTPLSPPFARGGLPRDGPKISLREGGILLGWSNKSPLYKGGLRGGNPVYPSYLLNTRQAFCPPKPKALDRTTRTSFLRAWLGT
jgi:hypothetical protein